MTGEEKKKAIDALKISAPVMVVTQEKFNDYIQTLNKVMNWLEQESIDKSAMMYEIYMEGVNMSGEYQGCWVRFKDIEKIVDKYMGDKE